MITKCHPIILLPFILALLLSSAALANVPENASAAPSTPKTSGAALESSPAPAPADAAVPATAPVLDPDKFFGNARAGYMAAKEAPDICLKLFCYCGCDLTDEHKSLLDCFTSDHGVDCHICQEEALIGLKMKRQGKSVAEIQKAVDIMFYKQYPFDEVSPALKKYRAERLWKGTEAAAAGHSETKAGRKTAQKKSLPTANKGKNAGSCCSGHGK